MAEHAAITIMDMIMKKKTLFAALAAALAFAGTQDKAAAQESTAVISYSLPKTVLTFDVKATQEMFYSGPYAKYASKYLGITVGLEDKTTTTVTEVNLRSRNYPDLSKRYSLSLNPTTSSVYVRLAQEGLIATPQEGQNGESAWAFPAAPKEDFSSKGIPANLTSTSSSLYGKAGDMVVQQSLVIEKTLEKKAQEVAEMIFKIRENKYKILVGDTDATYSGEAMKATIDELTKMEENYLTLFTGYSQKRDLRASFEVLPSPNAKSQVYVAFRLSDTEGLLSADNMSGKPYFLELTPEAIAEVTKVEPGKNQKLEQELFCRIPAVCSARLTDGVTTVLQSRVSVSQLGADEVYPIYTKK